MIIALQRCRTARDAILLIGNLAERYGFLGSCANDGESLSITDPSEAWIMEILGAGFDWQPGTRPVPSGWPAESPTTMRLFCAT
jgi:dipeptidase